MACQCQENCKFIGNAVVDYKKKYLLELEVNPEWKVLYKCKLCNSFWEERSLGGRWNENIELIKVTNEYVSEKWGLKYLD